MFCVLCLFGYYMDSDKFIFSRGFLFVLIHANVAC